MTREPLWLYAFRVIVGLGLFVFMLMLYWSSNLVEGDLKEVHADLSKVKSELSDIRKTLQNPSLGALQKFSENTSTAPATTKKESRSHIDPSLPNLLEEDPFYITTLPKILGANFKPQGTFHNATIGKPNNLHPFNNWSQVVTWTTQCSVSVARNQIGKYETFAPDMAIKVEERISSNANKTEFWIHLRDHVFWQPLQPNSFPTGIHLAPHFLKKHQVTAHDFKFYWDAMMNPFVQEPGAVALRTYFEDIDSIEVVDDLTFIVRWKHAKIEEPDGKVVYKMKYIAKQLTGQLRPLARFVYQYFADGNKILDEDVDPNTYRTNSVWAQNFNQHWAKNVIVSCGPWIFEGMTDRQITFKRNPDHYAPLDVLVEGSEIQFKDSPDAIWLLFKANQIDSYEIRPTQLLELEEFLKSPQYLAQKKEGASINRLEFLTRAYAYIGWNEAKVFFTNKKVRQALTMAIDRQRIIRQNLNGEAMEITGTFYPNSPSYDHSIAPWPYDPLRAKRLLEEEGWYDSKGTGVIEKEINGKPTPFRFHLTYYVKTPTTKAICEYIASALKEIGIDVQLNGVDIADLSAEFDNKSFDGLYLAWMLGTPPEDPKQIWYSSGAKQKGSSNSIGFANKEVDALIDALQYETDPQKRIELYHRFDRLLHEEAPYTFLYAPKTTLLYRNYLQNVFIPAERQDLIPGANVGEPDSTIFWLNHNESYESSEIN